MGKGKPEIGYVSSREGTQPVPRVQTWPFFAFHVGKQCMQPEHLGTDLDGF